LDDILVVSDVHAVVEDVQFDFAAADRLITLLRGVAAELRNQQGQRTSLAGVARAEWRGTFAEEFDSRMDSFREGAEILAESLTLAASQVTSLVEKAQQEQNRRDYARQYYADLADRNILQQAGGAVHDLLFGAEDEPVLNDQAPISTPVRVVRTIPGSRGTGY
jgi:hypothetical protein